MQNPYAIERFVQEHNAHAQAIAELQALQRQAAAVRRREAWESWRVRLLQVLRRPVGARRAQISTRLAGEGR